MLQKTKFSLNQKTINRSVKVDNTKMKWEWEVWILLELFTWLSWSKKAIPPLNFLPQLLFVSVSSSDTFIAKVGVKTVSMSRWSDPGSSVKSWLRILSKMLIWREKKSWSWPSNSELPESQFFPRSSSSSSYNINHKYFNFLGISLSITTTLSTSQEEGSASTTSDSQT